MRPDIRKYSVDLLIIIFLKIMPNDKSIYQSIYPLFLEQSLSFILEFSRKNCPKLVADAIIN